MRATLALPLPLAFALGCVGAAVGCTSMSKSTPPSMSSGGGAPDTGGSGGNGSGSGSGGESGPASTSLAPDGMSTYAGPYVLPAEATRQPGVPRATLDAFVFSTSAVFPNTSRNVNVFIPAQYVSPAAVPFMVIQDGDEQLASFKTDVVLENLIFQKRLPVMAAVFVHNPDNFGPERSLEYDCLDADYQSFVLDELLPEVRSRHPELMLTDDPQGRGALGKSSGGPASFTLGWLGPDTFRRILTLNGSFVNLCKNGPGADAYPALIRAADPKPLQVYLFSGSNDNAGFAAGNQAMADALAAKGYRWRYVFGQGAGHGNNFGSTFMTEALLWVWAGFPIE